MPRSTTLDEGEAAPVEPVSRWTRPPQTTAVRDIDPALGERSPAPRADLTVWVPAHGGAGVSTLLRWATDATEYPPDGLPSGRAPVVVSRATADGLAAGSALLGRLHRPPLGVVVVAGSPRPLPVALRRRLRLLASATPHTWQVPWVEDIHRGTASTCPAGVRRVLTAIDHRTRQLTDQTGDRS